MKNRLTPLFALVFVVVSAVAAADVKVVKITYKNQINLMAQRGETKQHKTVSFIGKERLRIDEKATTMIVRLDQQKVYIVNHDNKTISEIELLDGMPTEVAKGPKFNVVVNQTEEKREIGSWMARRYDVRMVSSMAKVEAKVWVTEDVGFEFDNEGFIELYGVIRSLQPEIKGSLKELNKIEGFEVARESIVSVSAQAGNSFTLVEKVISIAEIEVPDYTYDPPAAYEYLD